MMFPLVRDLAADPDRPIPVAVTCRVLGFSKQAYYKWRVVPVSQRDWDDAHLINIAVDIHHDDPEFGYRFITDELIGHGIVASRNRVNRLCTLHRIFSIHSTKRGTGRKPGPPVHDDLVKRKFTTTEPNLVLGIALVLLARGYDAAKLPALLAGIVAVAVTASSRLSRGPVKVTTTDRR